jgi:hypothetical protein
LHIWLDFLTSKVKVSSCVIGGTSVLAVLLREEPSQETEQDQSDDTTGDTSCNGANIRRTAGIAVNVVGS